MTKKDIVKRILKLADELSFSIYIYGNKSHGIFEDDVSDVERELRMLAKVIEK